MVGKKIVACMDILNNQVVKGINFVDIKTLGDPIVMAKAYQSQGADELVFLDISATLENKEPFFDLIKQVGKEISIPFSVGGGIKTVEQAKKLLESGASKISVASSVLENPNLLKELVQELGSDKVIVAIDVKKIDQTWWVFSKGGTQKTDYTAVQWAKEVQDLGAGQILLTSMNNDGVCSGFALDVTREVAQGVDIPVIVSGGAGSVDDFTKVLASTGASAALGASVFHYNRVSICEIKQALANL